MLVRSHETERNIPIIILLNSKYYITQRNIPFDLCSGAFTTNTAIITVLTTGVRIDRNPNNHQ